ncbi:hypothetical protein Actkin_03707 [Actinokineospora sp. UTMC 2448]|nr:hypothetical protein Actkin_03707 [Actinokineospora sp. UTMC 2448]
MTASGHRAPRRDPATRGKSQPTLSTMVNPGEADQS